jgi:glycosyltransferase involved in cell wall biosynthesis
MKVVVFSRKMPDLCGAFLHDVDLSLELLKRGHQVVFLTFFVPSEGYGGGHWNGFRFMHFSAGRTFLESSDIWVCPHSPILPDVRKLNGRGYNRPIVATCHFDGNYTSISRNGQTAWSEMLCCINRIMEPNYRKNIVPWPPQIVRTEVIRPILHKEKIVIDGSFQGDCITLINANVNKGVHQFLAIAREMPDHKFLGILPYYGERNVPPYPENVEWIKFDNDIRNILRRTRILLVPSYYESFGRVAVEAMINGIPVLYAKPAKNSVYPGGSTEGLQDWIEPAGIGLSREEHGEWVRAIQRLDDSDTYAEKSSECKSHIEAMEMFSEGQRIAELVESFSRQHPPAAAKQESQQTPGQQMSKGLREPTRPVGFGFSNGRLKIQR